MAEAFDVLGSCSLLTLLGYPERLGVCGNDLVHDSSELVEQFQALLLSHAGVVEAWQACLRQGKRFICIACVIAKADVQLPNVRARAHTHTLEVSVRMSLESLTRHCRGTVTSMTLDFSCFWLVSDTNFPYQALRMISPAVSNS